MRKTVSETVGWRVAAGPGLSAGGLAVIVLAMLMVFSVVLLWRGLSVPATAGLATTLAGASAELVRRASQHSVRRRSLGRSARPSGDDADPGRSVPEAAKAG